MMAVTSPGVIIPEMPSRMRLPSSAFHVTFLKERNADCGEVVSPPSPSLLFRLKKLKGESLPALDAEPFLGMMRMDSPFYLLSSSTRFNF
jgi:hypothetical protein